MADIFHSLVIEASKEDVYHALTNPDGLNQWYTLSSQGEPIHGSLYTLGFGPEYQWKAIVTKSVDNDSIELKFVKSDSDWMGTIIGFELTEINPVKTRADFFHKGWKSNSNHFRTSSYCWAMYLRILKRFLEKGEIVEYIKRLEV